MDVPVFFTIPTDILRLKLRRFTYSLDHTCPVKGNWGCDASVPIEDGEVRWGKVSDNGRGHFHEPVPAEEYAGDPRWPKLCEFCHQPFDERAEWQVFQQVVYRRADGGPGEFTLREAPVGMMWDAWWMPDRYFDGNGGFGWTNIGPDGLALVVRLPNRHDWMPESRASNCTMKTDNDHHCWIRHGDARKNEVHVDKQGKTCQAGAGSIQIPGYHGFLHHNKLTGVPA